MSGPGENLLAPRLARRLVAEGVGTFFLVFIGPGAVMVNAFTHGTIGNTGIALAFAFVVTAMVAGLGHLSGAHINPAVSVTLWSRRHFPSAELLPYVAAQCCGAILAAFALRAMLGTAGSSGATIPTISIPAAAAVEWLLSFVLMLVIMGTAVDERGPRGIAPIAIGLTVGLCSLMGGPLTGASMNPARSLGPAVAGQQWTAHWIYWLAPITGMIVAAWLYDWIRDMTLTLVGAGTVSAERPILGDDSARALGTDLRGHRPVGGKLVSGPAPSVAGPDPPRGRGSR